MTVPRGESAAGQALECSLEEPDLRDRLQAWNQMRAHVLSRSSEDGCTTTTFTNRPEVADSLRALMEAEKSCCPFLEFTLSDHGSTLQLELRYPQAFSAADQQSSK